MYTVWRRTCWAIVLPIRFLVLPRPSCRLFTVNFVRKITQSGTYLQSNKIAIEKSILISVPLRPCFAILPLCAHILKIDRTPHKRQNFVCCLKELVTFRCCLQTKCVRNQIKFDVCPQNRRKMVRTKHCCWGKCKTDSRYRKKWPKSLKKSRNKSSRNWEVQKVNELLKNNSLNSIMHSYSKNRSDPTQKTKLSMLLKGISHVSLLFADKVCEKSNKIWCLSPKST